MTTGDAVRRLWPTPHAAREARETVAGVCQAGRVTDEAASIASLLTSELVTNAYRHAGTVITLAVQCRDHHVTVAVGDDCEEPPRPATVEGTDGAGEFPESGRGLQLLTALAGAWGVRPRRDGKTVWFRVP